MSKEHLLIYEKPLKKALHIQSKFQEKAETTLTFSSHTLLKKYTETPHLFNKVILIYPNITDTIFSKIADIQETSPFAKIIILTKEKKYETLYKLITKGVLIYHIDSISELFTPTETHLKFYNAQTRIHQYLYLTIIKKLNKETDSNNPTIIHYQEEIKYKQQFAQILIIESDPSYSKILQNVFPPHNNITFVETGKDALEKIHQTTYELIIVSDFLSDIPTEKLLKKIQATKKNSRFILLTTINTSETLKKWQHYNIHNYILKPFESSRQLILTSQEEIEKKIISQLFYSTSSKKLLNLFTKSEKTKLLEEIYNLKKSINHPLYFEDILIFFPEANINKTHAKNIIPENRLREGIKAFLQWDF